jgi:hypothetical protein
MIPSGIKIKICSLKSSDSDCHTFADLWMLWDQKTNSFVCRLVVGSKFEPMYVFLLFSGACHIRADFEKGLKTSECRQIGFARSSCDS